MDTNLPSDENDQASVPPANCEARFDEKHEILQRLLQQHDITAKGLQACGQAYYALCDANNLVSLDFAARLWGAGTDPQDIALLDVPKDMREALTNLVVAEVSQSYVNSWRSLLTIAQRAVVLCEMLGSAAQTEAVPTSADIVASLDQHYRGVPDDQGQG